MTKTPKFTPGPWSLGYREGQQIYIETGPEPSLGYVDWNFMAAVFGSDDEPEVGEQVMLANANLITAAPELYAELQNAHVQLRMIADCIEAGRYDEALLHASSMSRVREAALAKARGEDDVV